MLWLCLWWFCAHSKFSQLGTIYRFNLKMVHLRDSLRGNWGTLVCLIFWRHVEHQAVCVFIFLLFSFLPPRLFMSPNVLAMNSLYAVIPLSVESLKFTQTAEEFICQRSRPSHITLYLSHHSIPLVLEFRTTPICRSSSHSLIRGTCCVPLWCQVQVHCDKFMLFPPPSKNLLLSTNLLLKSREVCQPTYRDVLANFW